MYNLYTFVFCNGLMWIEDNTEVQIHLVKIVFSALHIAFVHRIYSHPHCLVLSVHKTNSRYTHTLTLCFTLLHTLYLSVV